MGGKDGVCFMGSYGALVSFDELPEPPPEEQESPESEKSAESEPQPTSPEESETVEEPLSTFEVGQQLAQHVVGMNPLSIGSEEPKEEEQEDADKTEDGDEKKDQKTQKQKKKDKKKEQEKKLTEFIHQEFVMDSDITAGEFMKQNLVKATDFARFQCGEELPNEED